MLDPPATPAANDPPAIAGGAPRRSWASIARAILARPEWLIAIAVSALPVVVLGRMHADEVYQWLEPAFSRARGFGDLGWEWQVGIRNWAVPLLFSWLLRIGTWFGVDHPAAARALVAIPHVVLTVATLKAVRRWVERRGEPDRAALAVWLFGTYGLFVLFAGRSMAETYSAAALLIAVERLDARRPFTGGLWMGLAVVARYPSLVIVAGVALALALWDRRQLWRCAAGAALVLALLGALDWATWGRPFHSLRVYLDFNLFSRKAVEAFGAQPAAQYLPFVGRVAPWTWVGAYAASRRRIAGRLVLVPVALYVLVLLAIPHKEGRFLYPAILLLALIALPGWFAVVDSVRTPRLRRALLVAGFLVSPTSYFLFQKSLRGDLFWGVVHASRQPDVTGILVVGEGRWDVGGYFFIGKRVAYDVCPDAATCAPLLLQPRFDYVVARRAGADALAAEYGFRPYREGKTRLLRRAPAAR